MGHAQVYEKDTAAERRREALIRAVGQGDRDAFYRLYQDTARSLYSYILSLTGNPQEAEDVMQETYLTLWTRAASYVPQGKPMAWLFTIAKNLCFMRFRERKNQADVGLEEWESREEGACWEPLEQAAERRVLLDALGRIGAKERQIVLLHAAAGMKHREVARTLKMPLSTELSKYNRSMKKLQGILAEMGEGMD